MKTIWKQNLVARFLHFYGPDCAGRMPLIQKEATESKGLRFFSCVNNVKTHRKMFKKVCSPRLLTGNVWEEAVSESLIKTLSISKL